jgi:predicted RNA-binding protein Jag
MKQHDEKLYRYLDGRVSYAMHSWQDVAIPNLSSFDRKKAHSYISEKNIEKLRTYSEWEGASRCLHIVYEGERIAPTIHRTPSPARSLDISEDGIDV